MYTITSWSDCNLDWTSMCCFWFYREHQHYLRWLFWCGPNEIWLQVSGSWRLLSPGVERQESYPLGQREARVSDNWNCRSAGSVKTRCIMSWWYKCVHLLYLHMICKTIFLIYGLVSQVTRKMLIHFQQKFSPCLNMIVRDIIYKHIHYLKFAKLVSTKNFFPFHQCCSPLKIL